MNNDNPYYPSALALAHAIAGNDAEARAVLRAFLGVREILWEFGVRNARPNNKGETETKAPKPDGSGKPRRSAKKRPRVQRVRVEG